MAIAVRSSVTTDPPATSTARSWDRPTAATTDSPVVGQGVLVSRKSFVPRDHGEAIALFRASIVGAVVQRELSRGELAIALRTIAACKYRPPGSRVSKQFSLATVERWFYAYRRGGLDALRPAPRSDRGRARELTPEQRELLLDIRREHPTASVPTILRTLVADGRLGKDAVSSATVQRLYRA